MSGTGLTPDLLVDRRRLKRRLFFWRVLAILAAVSCVAVLVLPREAAPGKHLARVNIDGVIGDDRRLTDAVRALAKDDGVAAVIVSIDSPGGAVAGGESLYTTLGVVAAAKPVVAVMRGTAASAGYMAALPAERIFARDSTLTGSIGVILETFEAGDLLGRIGVHAEAITSGPLKDQPSFTRSLTPEGRAYLQGVVADMFDQFVAKVAEHRHMSTDQVRQLADGRAYTGRQALKLGLIDAIGGEPEVRAWLKDTHGISDTLPVRDLEMRGLIERNIGSLLDGLRVQLGGVAPAGAWAIWTGN